MWYKKLWYSLARDKILCHVPYLVCPMPETKVWSCHMSFTIFVYLNTTHFSLMSHDLKRLAPV